MRKCLKCGEQIPNSIKIGEKYHNLQRRKYCLKCSPFNRHNTKKIHKEQKLSPYSAKNYQRLDAEGKKIFNKYSYQQSCKKRRDKRKKDLVLIFGGKCIKCGYDKNLHNLCFHHRDPTTKLFEVNVQKLASKKWEVLLEEAKKCDLLCFHCHNDLHYPNGLNWKDENLRVVNSMVE
jgi:hypothetical protein